MVKAQSSLISLPKSSLAVVAHLQEINGDDGIKEIGVGGHEWLGVDWMRWSFDVKYLVFQKHNKSKCSPICVPISNMQHVKVMEIMKMTQRHDVIILGIVNFYKCMSSSFKGAIVFE